MSFNYGQRHKVELECSKLLAAEYAVKDHLIADLRSLPFAGSALTDEAIEVPEGRSVEEMTEDIPVTYVPGRNTMFLSMALSWAEQLGAVSIFSGVNALDYSGYPDCRPEYIWAFQKLIDLATKRTVEGTPIKLVTPLIDDTKIEIIHTGAELGVPYELTSSCYNPITAIDADDPSRIVPVACGKCDSCILRRQAFEEAGIPDPTLYQAQHRFRNVVLRDVKGVE